MIACLDFDKTLISINSFPRWIIFVLKKSIIEIKFRIFFKITYLIMVRKVFNLISHESFKKSINNISYPLSWSEEFCQFVYKSFLANNIYNFILSQKYDQIFISTAAPGCYARSISKIFEFDGSKVKIVSSDKNNLKHFENSKINKYLNTFPLFNGKQYTLFTDHIDDFYLAKKSTKTFLCNPDKHSLREYKKTNIKIEII